MFNTISIEGRLTRDPEFKTTSSGLAICNINVACDRDIKKEGKPALFIAVTFFGAMAENVNKWFKKGRGIIVTGRLENDVLEDKENPGKKRQVHYIAANAFSFPLSEGGGKKDNATKPEPMPQALDEPTPAFQGSNLDSLEISDDLLF